MSYCLNPNCPNPGDLLNAQNRICRHCGSLLVVQGRYRIKRLLGEGGFGKTFEVADERGQPKVLKVLTDSNSKAIALFQREAQVLLHLQHPGIPKIEAEGYFTYLPRNSTQPLHCLVMEKIEGCNLQEWLGQSQQPISEQQAVDWLKQLAEILHQVHQQQYFHRDIKPSNIMLRPTGQLVLIDFGSVREVTGTYLAKVGGGGGHKVTGIVSPGYTPPEQANGKAVPQSDFFALGRTFVYLLTGHDPNDFPENPRTGELMWREARAPISPGLGDLIDYLMAPFPGNRPSHTAVILQRLACLDRPASQQPSLPPVRGPAIPIASLRRSKRRRNSRHTSTFTLSKKIFFKSKKVAGLLLVVLGVTAASLVVALGGDGGGVAPKAPSSLAISVAQQPGSPVSPVSSPKVGKKMLLNRTLTGHLWGVNGVAISPDGQFLASGSVDKTVRVWNLPTGQLLHTLTGHNNEVWAVAISPDGKTVASGSGDNTVKLWDLGAGQLQGTLLGHRGWVLALAFSPDGKMLASGGKDNTIQIWDVAGTKLQATLAGHADGVNALVFSPRQNLLASAGGDNRIKLWDLSVPCKPTQPCQAKITLEANLRGVESLAFSPDGLSLAAGNQDGSISLWDINTGQVRRTLLGHSDAVNALVVSPDGKTLASAAGSLDSTIKLWDTDTGLLLDTLKGHIDSVHALAVAPDGKTLTSGSEDATIKIWVMGNR